MLKKKIYLSPSAQENNKYITGHTEKQVMNMVCDVVQRELKRTNGFEIYRNSPSMSLNEIVADSNAKVGKGGIHFAIHSNAGGGRGCEVYAYSPNTNSDRLAKEVYNRISPLTPTNDRGVKYNTSLAEIGKTTATAALIEIAFHDNVEDANFILNNIETIGIALAKGVCVFAGVTYIENCNQLQELQNQINTLKQENEAIKQENIKLLNKINEFKSFNLKIAMLSAQYAELSK